MLLENEYSSKTLEELKLEFTSVPHTSGAPVCPQCEAEKLLELDKVEGGGGVDFVTTLYYCSECGWFKVGERYWTTDY